MLVQNESGKVSKNKIRKKRLWKCFHGLKTFQRLAVLTFLVLVEPCFLYPYHNVPE